MKGCRKPSARFKASGLGSCAQSIRQGRGFEGSGLWLSRWSLDASDTNVDCRAWSALLNVATGLSVPFSKLQGCPSQSAKRGADKLISFNLATLVRALNRQRENIRNIELQLFPRARTDLADR